MTTMPISKHEKPKKVFNFKYYIISILRRASYRNQTRSEVLRESRVSRNTYVCKQCSKTFTRKEIAVDHIVPIVPISGFDTWDGLIGRLFCPKEGLQVLCKPDHKTKTNAENALRREYNAIQKKSSL